MLGHHKDGNVQNAITYLCIGPGLKIIANQVALLGSERSVLRWSNPNRRLGTPSPARFEAPSPARFEASMSMSCLA
jgi:hypothetical protein